MLVSNIKSFVKNNVCELQGKITSKALKRPFVLWWRFPNTCESYLDPNNGDPFVPALLVLSMKIGEPVEIGVPVSRKLMNAIPEIQKIYHSWDDTLSEVVVKAPIREEDAYSICHPSQTGLFFSLGVDSFYSLLKNLKSCIKNNEEIGYLIVVHGFDIRVGKLDSGHYPAVLANCQKVGQELGKNVLPVATNIRDISESFAEWGPLYNGASLASLGLTVECMFRKLYIASSHSYDRLFPWGSHPQLDPLWSTEYLSFVHDGAEVKRVDKVRFISEFPIALENLRVCWYNFHNRYNCGRCEKCLRTMIGLHIAGALEKCKTLPRSINVQQLRNMKIPDENERGFFEELANELSSSETDLAIKAALDECFATASTDPIQISVDGVKSLTIFQRGFIRQSIQYYRNYGLKRSLCRLFKKIKD